MTEKLIEELQPFLNRITSAPLPSIPGAGSQCYSQIHRIRIEAISNICRSLLVRTQRKHGYEAANELYLSLDSIRLDLLARFPDCTALLDAGTWPGIGEIH